LPLTFPTAASVVPPPPRIAICWPPKVVYWTDLAGHSDRQRLGHAHWHPERRLPFWVTFVTFGAAKA
jgi:hypothetical protein